MDFYGRQMLRKRGEWYYFYFCLSDGTEGVAKSKNPYGPFEDAVQITIGRKADRRH